MSKRLQLIESLPRGLRFGQDVRTDLRLLEVDEKLLQEMLTHGVSIKGSEHEEAVLCTATKTFALKYVETTNLQLLVEPEELSKSDVVPPVVVSATTKAHIEVVETAPRLLALSALLNERRYGAEDEEMLQTMPEGAGLYTFADLVERVQASEGELRSALTAMHAVELEGVWRLMDAAYMDSMLELVLLSAQEEGLPWHAIPLRAIRSSLCPSGYSPAVLRHCLSVFGRQLPEEGCAAAGGSFSHGGSSSSNHHDMEAGSGEAEQSTWSLDQGKRMMRSGAAMQDARSHVGIERAPGAQEQRRVMTRRTHGGVTVCAHVAAQLLSRAVQLSKPQPSVSEFMVAWQHAAPPGMTVDVEMLRGEVLMEDKGGKMLVRAFPAGSLPLDPAKRFAAIFTRGKPRWEMSELEPYLAGLKVPGLSVEALLLKYTRASKSSPEAQAIYSAR
ncbi:MAG: hypothetical protein WDW38_005699 [Sanguina aurantia]